MGPPWGAFCQITLTSCYISWLVRGSDLYRKMWTFIAETVRSRVPGAFISYIIMLTLRDIQWQHNEIMSRISHVQPRQVCRQCVFIFSITFDTQTEKNLFMCAPSISVFMQPKPKCLVHYSETWCSRLSQRPGLLIGYNLSCSVSAMLSEPCFAFKSTVVEIDCMKQLKQVCVDLRTGMPAEKLIIRFFPYWNHIEI